jgi:D-alanyl-D-alanine carboxypeptidase/D-alanyl-D-alanine-endopeptidase (penicillin-binding protein 4)
MRHLLGVSCAAALLAACQHATVTPRPSAGGSATIVSLRAAIDSMADAPEFSNAHWGILIVDPERGDTLYSRNAGKLFMPASNMKILTSATALTLLGPD